MRAEVVALGVLVAGRVVSAAYPGLRGVRQGGRYVIYRLTAQPGFVAGVTRAQENGLPVQAVVTSDGLPFVGQAGGDGAYVVASATGTVNLTARVPGTSLLGTGTVAVSAGQTSALDLSLLGSVSTALVRPPDGAVNVATGVQVEVEAAVALDPGSVTDDGVQLLKVEGAVETAVAVRRVLSASRRLLAVIPTAALAYDSLYRLRVSGLADAVGGAVTVPVSTFRTQTDAPPQYDLTKLVITIPDENGLVHVSAVAGTLMPGTRVLIINAGNGVVVSFTADNDGALQGEFPASVEDRLLITITDPLGNVVNVERSQYFDPATGLTTLGLGGGEIGDPDVPEARVVIPAGALDTPVRLKVTHVGPEVVPEDQRPQMGEGAVLASGLRLESPEKPDFKKGLKLRFPRPAAAPEGSSFFVLRQVSGPEGVTAYEAVAEAAPVAPATPFNAPETPGRTSQGVRAPGSAPNQVELLETEVSSAWSSFMGTVAGSGVVQNAATNLALLMYSYRVSLPGAVLPGAITGKVLQAQWASPGEPVTYKPAAGALVVGRDAGGQQFLADRKPFSRVDVKSDGDGHFLLWDLSYNGGPVTVTAQYGGQTRTATAYEVDPASTHSDLRGRFSQTSATIVFPATEPPPPPPAARVRLFKLLANDQRQEILNGLVPEDEPVLIGVTPERPAGLPPGDPLPYDVGTQGVEIQGSNQGLQVERDPLGQTSPNHALANRWLVQDTTRADGLYVPANPGTYTVRVKLDPTDPQASPFYVTYVFRVLGAGGGVTTDPDNPPQVLAQQTRPRAGATGVPVEVYPQIAFSEPVKKARSAVSLKNAAGEEVQIRLLGVNAQGPVADVTDQSEVTAVTVQPLSALEYGKLYSLQVSTVLEDLDPQPKNLPAVYTSGFTTFRPGDLEPESGQESIAGLAVLEDRAYVAQTHYRGGIVGGQVYQNGTLVTLDISDPTLLKLDDPQIRKGEHRIPSPPSDLALDPERKLVAVPAGPLLAYVSNPDGYYEVRSSPSNVYLYSVETDQPELKGVVSFTTGLMDGQVQRVVLHGGRIYTTTHRKGLQLVDVATATTGFPGYASQGWMSLWQTYLGLRGAGYKVEDVVTIPVLPSTPECAATPPASTCVPIALNDLEAAGLNWRGAVQTLLLTTGRADVGLLIADPAGVQVIRRMALPGFAWGEALGLATVNSKPLAVVGGTKQGGGGIVHVVDLSPLATDQALLVLGTVEIPAPPSDILITGTIAIVATNTGTAYLVSLVDPVRPALIGTIQGVGSKIVLTDTNILLSTARSYMTGTQELRGLHATAMERMAIVRRVTPSALVPAGPLAPVQAGPTRAATAGASTNLVTARDVSIEFQVIPADLVIEGSPEVSIFQNTTPVQTLMASAAGFGGTAVWPAQTPVLHQATYAAQAVVTVAGGQVLQSPLKRIPLAEHPVDLEMQGLQEESQPEPNELAPGAFLPLNDDDDDKSEQPDYKEGTPLSPVPLQDDELLPIKATFVREFADQGTFELTVLEGGNRVRVWKDSRKSEQLVLPRRWSASPWLAGGDALPATLYVEGIQASEAPGDVRLQLSLERAPGEVYQDVVRLTVGAVDLDIDSDNNNLLVDPLRSEDEDRIEDSQRAGRPGKYVLANINNDDVEDEDEIPDFADGFDRDPVDPKDDIIATPTSGPPEHWVPLVLQLSPGVDLTKAQLRVTYEASDPAGVTRVGTMPDFEYRAAPGQLRIWLEDGLTPRRAASVAANPAGHFVPANAVLTPAQLRLTPASRTVKLYLEGTDRSAALATNRIFVEVDPDGPGPLGFMAKDAVRTTVVRVRLVDIGDRNKQVIGGTIAWIKADPDPRMPQLNVRVEPDPSATLNAEWSLKATYRDHNRNDEVLVPHAVPPATQTPVQLATSQPWDIVSEMAAIPAERRVFGGSATLKVRIGTLFEQELQFRIRGENPPVNVARPFIDSIAPLGAWYTYAIAKAESAQGSFRYNQFNESPSRIKGTPNWGHPDGWGMFQTDSASGHRIELRHIWNWQENARLGVGILGPFVAAANNYMQGQRNTAGAVPVPDEPVGNCLFSDSGATRIEGAVAMKMYNGGFATPRYVRWSAAATPPAWIFNRVSFWTDANGVQHQNFYVQHVCLEVEP